MSFIFYEDDEEEYIPLRKTKRIRDGHKRDKIKDNSSGSEGGRATDKGSGVGHNKRKSRH